MVSALRDPIVNNLCKLFECQVAFNDPGVGHFGLENAVIPIGTDFLEVVSPKENNTTAGRYLKKRNGDGGYMVIIQVNDFMKAKKHVKKNAIDIVWESDHQEAKAIHLHPKQMGGAIVSLDWMNPKESWKWAGPNWKEFVSKKRVKRIVGVEIQSKDHQTIKNKWQSVLNIPEEKNIEKAHTCPNRSVSKRAFCDAYCPDPKIGGSRLSRPQECRPPESRVYTPSPISISSQSNPNRNLIPI